MRLLTNQRLARAVGRTKLYQAYNRRFGRFDHTTIEHFIHEYSRRRRCVFFIQVGGNDGITWDPIHFFVRRDGWTGVILEPQREVFETKLKATYRDAPGITLLNAAVDLIDGSRHLYKYSFTSSRWATGVASFDRNRLITNFNSEYIQANIRREGLTVSPNPEDYVASELVCCLSFDSVLDTAHHSTIDFLITDVEGYDVQLLETFPLDRTRPANIIFELPLERDVRFLGLVSRLREHGYCLFIAGSDAIAIRRDSVAT